MKEAWFKSAFLLPNTSLTNSVDMTDLQRLIDIVATLRGPHGCPWDQKQSMQSICTHIIEEAYEWVAAIQSHDMPSIMDEAGDVLLHVVMISQMASEIPAFTIDEVIATVAEKMIRRHPHVFGDQSAQSVDDVMTIWEQVKSKEKASQTPFERIPTGITALMSAEKIQKVAAKTGFEFEHVNDAIAKIREELLEVEAAAQAGDQADIQDELGDLLFSVVNVCRLYKVPTEPALVAANQKFKQRFEKMEAICREKGDDFQALSLAQKEVLWQQSKQK